MMKKKFIKFLDAISKTGASFLFDFPQIAVYLLKNKDDHISKSILRGTITVGTPIDRNQNNIIWLYLFPQFYNDSTLDFICKNPDNTIYRQLKELINDNFNGKVDLSKISLIVPTKDSYNYIIEHANKEYTDYSVPGKLFLKKIGWKFLSYLKENNITLNKKHILENVKDYDLEFFKDITKELGIFKRIILNKKLKESIDKYQKYGFTNINIDMKNKDKEKFLNVNGTCDVYVITSIFNNNRVLLLRKCSISYSSWIKKYAASYRFLQGRIFVKASIDGFLLK